jgi:hypothetical protein
MNDNFVKNYTSEIEGGNTIRFEALSSTGRIMLEGTGTIVVEVSVDATNYTTVTHEVSFTEGKAIAPFRVFIGDHVRISATTLTSVIINYNTTKDHERY